MALLATEQSLDAQDFFLNGGFEGPLDDNGVDPWSDPDVPFGRLGPGHLLVRASLPPHAHPARCPSTCMHRRIAKAAASGVRMTPCACGATLRFLAHATSSASLACRKRPPARSPLASALLCAPANSTTVRRTWTRRCRPLKAYPGRPSPAQPPRTCSSIYATARCSPRRGGRWTRRRCCGRRSGMQACRRGSRTGTPCCSSRCGSGSTRCHRHWRRPTGFTARCCRRRGMRSRSEGWPSSGQHRGRRSTGRPRPLPFTRAPVREALQMRSGRQ